MAMVVVVVRVVVVHMHSFERTVVVIPVIITAQACEFERTRARPSNGQSYRLFSPPPTPPPPHTVLLSSHTSSLRVHALSFFHARACKRGIGGRGPCPGRACAAPPHSSRCCSPASSQTTCPSHVPLHATLFQKTCRASFAVAASAWTRAASSCAPALALPAVAGYTYKIGASGHCRRMYLRIWGPSGSKSTSSSSSGSGGYSSSSVCISGR